MDFEQIKEILTREDESFRLLVEEHRTLDRQLRELATRRYLSTEEQLQEVALKKQKLALKDKMLMAVEAFTKKNV